MEAAPERIQQLEKIMTGNSGHTQVGFGDNNSRDSVGKTEKQQGKPLDKVEKHNKTGGGAGSGCKRKSPNTGTKTNTQGAKRQTPATHDRAANALGPISPVPFSPFGSSSSTSSPHSTPSKQHISSRDSSPSSNKKRDSESPSKKKNIYSYFSKSGGGGRSPQLQLEFEEKLQERDEEIKGLKKDLSSSQWQVENLQGLLEGCQNKLNEAEEELRTRQGKVNTIMVEMVRKLAQNKRQADEALLIKQRRTIGRVVSQMQGHVMVDAWEAGELFTELVTKQARLEKEFETLTAQRTKLKKRRAQLSRQSKKETKDKEKGKEDSPLKAGKPEFKRPKTRTSLDSFHPAKNLVEALAMTTEEDEILKLRLFNLKKAQSECKQNEAELDGKKEQAIRFQQLQANQETSRFSDHPILNDRYVLLHMLGKGGFSEVYQAFDLEKVRHVACKIHQLNQSWNDERKRNYTKHATREYDIHKNLDHSRITNLFDVFAIDLNSFCTVMEFCDGDDLDMHLKRNKTLSEREAKTIIMQVFHGLKYLSEQKQRVIHYDLKPGNILFHNGAVKITDFGLSKIMQEDSSSIELTSQGCGTYWYLPPECFQLTSQPQINSKVDVWSAGVILFQMLYGFRPFGEGLSPERLLQLKTIASAGTQANQLQFPAKPPVSQPMRNFISRLLAHNPNDRPDVLSVFTDPFFKPHGKNKAKT